MKYLRDDSRPALHADATLSAYESDEAPKLVSGVHAGPLVSEILGHYRRKKSRSQQPLDVCLDLINWAGDDEVVGRLRRLSPPWRDHAIACVYAALMSNSQRKALGAYFTPPHLVEHLLWRLRQFGVDPQRQTLRDPAAGGAAFIVPLARLKAHHWRLAGLSDRQIAERLQSQLCGQEIDADLSQLANALVHRMLETELRFRTPVAKRVQLVRTGDSLAPSALPSSSIDHQIGNPPYGRLARLDREDVQSQFADIIQSRTNLYAMFVRRALDEVPADGLVGYILPASFIGGPEFALFRKKVVERAEVLAIDTIQKRRDLFIDATTDACFLILRRRPSPQPAARNHRAASGIVDSDGSFATAGTAAIAGNGKVWKLPGIDHRRTGTIADWGYKATVGYLVANRQPDRMHKRQARDRYPLIWAAAITPAGRFDFEHGKAHRGFGWTDAPSSASYVIRTACVAIQRTSARNQKRRLNAAAIPKAFVDKYGGIVGENHVILLVPTRKSAAPVSALAKALNTPSASEELNRICGSASISVRLLEGLRIARPKTAASRRDPTPR
jgi:adenine-specific DNA-methyltransferase